MRSVVLPQPEGPSIEKNSPSSMSNERSSTATASPNIFVTRSTRTSISFGTPNLLDPARRSRRGGGHHHLSVRSQEPAGSEMHRPLVRERTSGEDMARQRGRATPSRLTLGRRLRPGRRRIQGIGRVGGPIGSAPPAIEGGERRDEEQSEGRQQHQAHGRAPVDQPHRERARADQRSTGTSAARPAGGCGRCP